MEGKHSRERCTATGITAAFRGLRRKMHSRVCGRFTKVWIMAKVSDTVATKHSSDIVIRL